MKVNLIIPTFYPATGFGGPIFSTLYAAKALSSLDNIELIVSTTNANANKAKKLDVKINTPIEFNQNFFVKYYNAVIGEVSFSLFTNIWKEIKSADVVHLQAIFGTAIPVSLLYAKIFKKPLLLSPRGSLCEWCLNQGNGFKCVWLRLFIKPFANSITWHATSDKEKEDILEQFPKATVYKVPNGIDIEAFTKVNYYHKETYTQKYLQIKQNPSKIIVSMGRLHKVKGFDILIKSFQKICLKYPDAILLIAGKDAGEKAHLDKLIESHKLTESIFFVGEVSDQDKIDFLANADLFILPSHTENFGNVYVESLAAGTPIIASTGTPWSEVESYHCGKWVENSVESTTKAALILLEQDRKVLRKNALILAEKYNWKTIAKQFKAIFVRMENPQ
ncbi:MAG: Putative glycosyltransferase [uncultured Sulfurovum sp.]|uniref:Glycosyltransferase n=1 Tax=uncultured Sulfurovum sp. TaxID=269237 RepID=A0A6S6SMZ8_9BACT|nr:MAG: Putative glycosyltransferase [uncultured Sulfurovum sp.]